MSSRRATASAVTRSSPVDITTPRPAARSSASATAVVGLIRIGDCDAAGEPSVDDHGDDRRGNGGRGTVTVVPVRVAVRPRRANGYRDYGEIDVRELQFIRRARLLGFAIPEIADLLSLWRDRGRASCDVHRLAAEHLVALETRIAEMRAMARTLGHLVAACHGDDRPDCPILDDLGGVDAGQTTPS